MHLMHPNYVGGRDGELYSIKTVMKRIQLVYKLDVCGWEGLSLCPPLSLSLNLSLSPLPDYHSTQH